MARRIGDLSYLIAIIVFCLALSKDANVQHVEQRMDLYWKYHGAEAVRRSLFKIQIEAQREHPD